jgi:hypothetical protein
MLSVLPVIFVLLDVCVCVCVCVYVLLGGFSPSGQSAGLLSLGMGRVL